MATKRQQVGLCVIHAEWCIPTARRLYALGLTPDEVGTEYRDEMLRLAALDYLRGVRRG